MESYSWIIELLWNRELQREFVDDFSKNRDIKESLYTFMRERLYISEDIFNKIPDSVIQALISSIQVHAILAGATLSESMQSSWNFAIYDRLIWWIPEVNDYCIRANKKHFMHEWAMSGTIIEEIFEQVQGDTRELLLEYFMPLCEIPGY